MNVCCALNVRSVRRLVCSNTQFQVEALFQNGEPLGGGDLLEDLVTKGLWCAIKYQFNMCYIPLSYGIFLSLAL